MSHRLSNNKKRKLKAIIAQAGQSLSKGDPVQCEAYCRHADAIRKDEPEIANIRGTIAAKYGDIQKAESLFQQAIKHAPKIAAYHENLARVYDMAGEYTKCAASYRQAIQCDAFRLSARLGYCNALLHLHAYDTIIQILETQYKRYPKHPDLLTILALAYMNARQFEPARIYLDKLLTIDPKHVEANRQMGLLNSYEGNIRAAKSCFYTAISAAPDNIPAYGNLAAIKRYDDPADPDITRLKQLHQRGKQTPEQRSALNFILGKMHDDLGEYDTAFSYFQQGNELRSQARPFDRDQEFAQLEAIMANYSGDVLMNNSGIEDDTPIFIIGMARCGSTLVEQIISSHAQADARGECNLLKGVALAGLHSDSNPLTVERMASLSKEELQQVGQDYLAALRGNDANTHLHITDKSLKNFSLAGVIHCALPKARIIHVSRHPLDTCISIYQHDFPGERLTLGELGYFYRMYQRVMQHWRDILPEGIMYEINYADLVQNQEAETRKLLAFCGLPWDEQCLQFHRNRNRVETSSIAQVRRPIYKDSLATWQRYERHLQPLIKILGTGD